MAEFSADACAGGLVRTAERRVASEQPNDESGGADESSCASARAKVASAWARRPEALKAVLTEAQA
jgi:hypothetical protein